MSDIFISYTGSDRDWAFWIGQELERLGHAAHIHEWEIDAGGNIPAWMQERQEKADHTLCVVSAAYLSRPYSSWELHAAQWAAASDRPNFMIPVFVEGCKAPTMLAPFKRCDLFGLNEREARALLEAYLKPAAKPLESARFPGGERKAFLRHTEVAAFPGRQNTRLTTMSDDSATETNKGLERDKNVVPSSLPPAERGSTPRLVLISTFVICALGVIAWMLLSLQGGTNLKTGDCSIASSGTANRNRINCTTPPVPSPKP